MDNEAQGGSEDEDEGSDDEPTQADLDFIDDTEYDDDEQMEADDELNTLIKQAKRRSIYRR